MESWLAHQGSLGRRVTLPLYPAHGLKFSLSCLLCFIISDHWLVQVRAAVLKKKQWKRDKHHWWWTRTARFYAVYAGVWYRLVQLQGKKNSLQQFVVLFEVFIFIFKVFWICSHFEVLNYVSPCHSVTAASEPHKFIGGYIAVGCGCDGCETVFFVFSQMF